jgi:hypothetical protein|tara:strand:- start:110 stop:280 length:171 start_codon:yes stop_codon:yes gene_type:complete
MNQQEITVEKKIGYLSEAKIIRHAGQERSKAVAEFFNRLFSRDKHDVALTHAVATE